MILIIILGSILESDEEFYKRWKPLLYEKLEEDLVNIPNEDINKASLKIALKSEKAIRQLFTVGASIKS